MTRLWDRGTELDAAIARFTVGRDLELDLRLVAFDALASMAHAVMLKEIGVLNGEELAALRPELAAIAREARQGEFHIPSTAEDGHTAIENRLTERLGDAGRRIHTGRSRNDQVIAALRLWAREACLQQGRALLAAIEALLELAEEHRETSFPGYTHTRQAMPSTLGLFFAAFASNLLDDFPWLRTAFEHADRSPLGSASGYGVALPLNRQLVSRLLGFREVQSNTLAVQNDRGKMEFLVLSAGAAMALDLGRLATDLIWFSSAELGFMGLGDTVTTGSSIMPQKRNPDVLELIRATSARVRSRQSEIAAIYGSLTAGYHRDLQHTKEPFLEAVQNVTDSLLVLLPVLDALVVDRERCRAAMELSIGSTDAVYQRVARGEAFRSAYKAVAVDPESAVEGDPAEAWRLRTHQGAPGSLDLAGDRDRLAEAGEWLETNQQRVGAAWQLLEV
ncbi:MAG: argininosuccinate lyase [Deltaproteobacteria bacterium]|nr:argininosuccinate lyase [Deltaproteobacteria bacterium]